MGTLKVLQILGGGVVERMVDRPMDIIQQQLQHYNTRKNLAHEQQLRQEDERFQQEMALENRRRNAEIDALIADKDLERQSKIAETIANYQKTMAECSVSIGRSLGAMNIELRERATALVEEKQERYSKLQADATEKAMAQFESIAARFPEGSKPREIMEESVGRQLNNIIETSYKFLQTIDADFSRMMESIGRITEKTMDNANQYISPTFAKSVTNQKQLE